MDQKAQVIFDKLFQLREELESQFASMSGSSAAERFNTNEQSGCYYEYWHLIHDNFEKSLVNKVGNKIGYGNFFDKVFLNTLYEMYESLPRILDEYKGYELKSAEDCWGNVSAFVYLSGRQFSEAIDLFDEQSLIKNFRLLIDNATCTPDFGELN